MTWQLTWMGTSVQAARCELRIAGAGSLDVELEATFDDPQTALVLPGASSADRACVIATHTGGVRVIVFASLDHVDSRAGASSACWRGNDFCVEPRRVRPRSTMSAPRTVHLDAAH